ncbi:hypothetical protein KGZ01_18245 [Pseudomonas aeruginosa]|uniref:hypothetical protein n=1 Tax=Pseudomonas aeruginosa TaxID=287 RepID=UPI002340AD1E|nr:hypothetical protein [Pseudomonas aeruginosa]MDC3993171.1 hypothetical protein [Pseudomonas aeruginosa]
MEQTYYKTISRQLFAPGKAIDIQKHNYRLAVGAATPTDELSMKSPFRLSHLSGVNLILSTIQHYFYQKSCPNK